MHSETDVTWIDSPFLCISFSREALSGGHGIIYNVVFISANKLNTHILAIQKQNIKSGLWLYVLPSVTVPINPKESAMSHCSC